MSIQHKDIPDTQLHETKGAATASNGQILFANGSGGASWQSPTFSYSKLGWWDYNDTATATTQIPLTSAGNEYQLTNNGLGTRTNKVFRITSISDIFNTTTNYFSFTGLTIGDTVDIRVDIEVTTASANNLVDLILELGIGGTSYKLTVDQRIIKSAGTSKIVVTIPFYIGDSNTLNNTARFLIKNDTVGSTVKVNGWFVKVITHG
jgi:hypothetical protein